jgi:hypothetical protein
LRVLRAGPHIALLEGTDLRRLRAGRIEKTAFFRCGDAEIELIEPVDAEHRRERLGGNIRARVEHIAIEVDDLANAIQALEGMGVRATTDEPIEVGGRLNVFTRPETSGDMMHQFLQYLDGGRQR